jgi:DNA polymerase I-like protein with 3'-5' exonuclease and polymerase domains
LNCSTEKAQSIKDSVFRAFPAIKRFEDSSLAMARELGYVTTVCGRKRRLPDLLLDEYEFKWINGVNPNVDVLDFDEDEEQQIPERTVRKYLTRLHNCRFNEKRKIFEQANKEGIWIIDNGAKIADATRQCVNSRIQGSAADLTKLAMVYASRNERLKELGFRLLIQVHDELIGECPEENMKECSELLAQVMSESAEKILEMPVKCDVDLMYQWYGEKIVCE